MKSSAGDARTLRMIARLCLLTLISSQSCWLDRRQRVQGRVSLHFAFLDLHLRQASTALCRGTVFRAMTDFWMGSI